MAEAPRVLVVGAGAVGQVYGRHLMLGGAELTFFVRDKYRAEAARGFDVFPLNRPRSRRHQSLPFQGFEVMTSAREVAERPFDSVWLCVSSPALAGDWLAEVLAAAGDATIVSIQPGLDDRQRLVEAGASEDRLVSGMVGFLSYHAPLPGETVPTPGMAYWFPPGSPSLFSGPGERTQAVVQALRRGGCPARAHPDAFATAKFPSAFMLSYFRALELADWSFRRIVRGEQMALGARGVRESFAVLSQDGARAPWALRVLARPAVLRVAVWIAARIMPLPLEPYIKVHFTKVNDQTLAWLRATIARGHEAGLEVGALEALLAGDDPKRRPAAGGAAAG